jgi:E3 ubiquitin-protein ligase UBR2
MDKVTRQVGQHVEFDPEWETAFNLVIKIQSILSSILDWCSHDVSKTKKNTEKN